MQTIASTKSGEPNSKIFNIPIDPEVLLKIKLTKNVPRYKLPMSPIKIFDGDQLKYKNPLNVPINGKR